MFAKVLRDFGFGMKDMNVMCLCVHEVPSAVPEARQ